MRMNSIPAQHTVAILSGLDEVIYSGMATDSRVKWDNLPFENPGGIYQYVARAIDGKWYRTSWVQFS